jgi:Arabidopsis protein of unknown function
MKAISTTAFASMLLFTGTRVLSTKTITSLKPSKRLMVGSFAKKRAAEEEINTLQRLEEFEECINSVECGSERVFRSLIYIRVSLLNITTLSL